MGNRIKPITPAEVVGVKQKLLPDAVLSAFNELIAERWDGYQSKVEQDSAINRIMNLINDENLTRQMIFDNHWLNVEDVYRKHGWEVKYDQPGHDEDYKSFYVFRKQKK